MGKNPPEQRGNTSKISEPSLSLEVPKQQTYEYKQPNRASVVLQKDHVTKELYPASFLPTALYLIVKFLFWRFCVPSSEKHWLQPGVSDDKVQQLMLRVFLLLLNRDTAITILFRWASESLGKHNSLLRLSGNHSLSSFVLQLLSISTPPSLHPCTASATSFCFTFAKQQ